MASHMTMALEVGGVETTVWQKVETVTKEIVTSQRVSYVDSKGMAVDLPETYEMSVIDGVEHDAPGEGQ